MNGIVISGLYVLAGVSAYAAFNHFSVGLRRPFDRTHILFAVISLLAVPFACFHAALLQADSLPQFVFALRWNLAAVLVMLAIFPWFIASYTGEFPRSLLVGLSALFVVLLVLNLTQPYTLQYDQIDGIRKLRLPWGEVITRGAGHHGAIAYVGMVATMTTFVYSLYATGRAYFRHRRSADLVMAISICLLLVSSLEGVLARLSIVHFVETGPLGILAVLIAMSVVLGYETQQRLRRSERQFRALFENSPTAMVAVDPVSRRIVQANPNAVRMTGYGAEEILTRTVLDITCPEDRAAALQRHEQLIYGQADSLHYERRFLRKDGSIFFADSSMSTLKDADGRVVYLIGSAVDITERKQIEKSLVESEDRLRAIIKQSPVGIAFYRDGGITADVNEAYLKMFGYEDAAELIGKPVLTRIAPQSRDKVMKRIEQVLRGDHNEAIYEVTALRKDGSQFPMYVSSKRMQLQDGPLTTTFVIDVTERKEAEEKIEHLAFYDHLTDLPNRRLLLDRLNQALDRSARNRCHGALLLIDLDNFKTLNDTLGHAIGDVLLQQVAERLKSCVREVDTVARFGGDEFVVIVEDLGENAHEAAAHAETVGRKILAELSQPFFLAAYEFHGTSSVGATLFGEARHPMEELLKQADIAMYQSKKLGRNALRFFDPEMQHSVNLRAAIEREMHGALEGGQFHLYYQVQANSAQQPIGAEALLRWIHPDNGFRSPAQFIPIAEETGLILPIGQWVIETACAQIEAWGRDELTRKLVLSVNVSAKQFHMTGFADQVIETVRRHGINPACLKLELTESVLLGNIEDAITTMTSLSNLGVQFSLDDFGTGYSSLQYLRQLPISQLKIDQSFVRDIAADGSALAIVHTIIAMAHSLGLDVIAEGVENEAERRLLQKSGCESYQGYLFGRPVTIEQFEAQLHCAVS